jgi:hypothetical protein
VEKSVAEDMHTLSQTTTSASVTINLDDLDENGEEGEEAAEVVLRRAFVTPIIESTFSDSDPRSTSSNSFVTGITTAVNVLKNTMTDFKMGSTILLKYFGPQHCVYLSCNVGNEWVDDEFTIKVDCFDEMRPDPHTITSPHTDEDSVHSDNVSGISSVEFVTARMAVSEAPLPSVTDKLKDVPCLFFHSNGSCRFGDKCRHGH